MSITPDDRVFTLETLDHTIAGVREGNHAAVRKAEQLIVTAAKSAPMHGLVAILQVIRDQVAEEA